MTRAKPVDTSILDQYEAASRQFDPKKALDPHDYAVLLAGVREGRSSTTLVKYLKGLGVTVGETTIRRWKATL